MWTWNKHNQLAAVENSDIYLLSHGISTKLQITTSLPAALIFYNCKRRRKMVLADQSVEYFWMCTLKSRVFLLHWRRGSYPSKQKDSDWRRCMLRHSHLFPRPNMHYNTNLHTIPQQQVCWLTWRRRCWLFVIEERYQDLETLVRIHGIPSESSHKFDQYPTA